MKLPPVKASTRRRQRGFSAVLMLGVTLLMGGMLAYGVGMTSGMNAGLSTEIASARVHQAAAAGLEWGRFRLTQTGPVCAAAVSFTPPLSAGGTPVTVTCRALPATNDGGAVAVYRLTATACNQPLAGACPNAGATADYVQAQLSSIVYR